MTSDQIYNNFWGDKHIGFDVMFQNMKQGSKTVSDFHEFLRESCTIEDNYIKSQSKLSRQMNSYMQGGGSFTPCWDILKDAIDRITIIHGCIMHELQELMRDEQRYQEEQQKRHKAIKEGEVPTQEVVKAFQITTAQLAKAKDLYHTKYRERDKIRRNENSSSRETERAETKLKKAQDDYKYNIERYNSQRTLFISKIRSSSAHFQEVETKHLELMRDFVKRYGLAWEKSSTEINKMCSQFKNNLESKTVNLLLLTFASQKGTGSREPPVATFEEADLSANNESQNDVISIGSLNNDNSMHNSDFMRPSSVVGDPMNRKPSVADLADRLSNHSEKSDRSDYKVVRRDEKKKNIFSRRQRESLDKSKKKVKSSSNLRSSGSTTPTDWRSETRDELPKDDEGYSIPPPNPWESSRPDSSSSSSDDDDTEDIGEKLKFEIKPFAPNTPDSNPRATPSLIAPAPRPAGLRNNRARSTTPNEALKKSISLAENLANGNTPNDLEEHPAQYFPKSSENPSTDLNASDINQFISHVNIQPPSQDSKTQMLRSMTVGEPTFTPEFPASPPKRRPLPQPPSQAPAIFPDPWGSTSVTNSEQKDNWESFPSIGNKPSFNRPPPPNPPPALPPTSPPAQVIDSQGVDKLANRLSRPLPQTPQPSELMILHQPIWGDTRGPSPAPLLHTDPLPVAVAFTETWDALFVGAKHACQSSTISGELSMAFPAGILRLLTDESGVRPLVFRLSNANKIKRLVINAKIIEEDVSGPNMYQFSINTPALATQLRAMRDKSPTSNYFNVDLCKYVVRSDSFPPPIKLKAYWKCEPTSMDFHLDYSQNWPEGTKTFSPDIRVYMNVSGDVTQMQSIPMGAWSVETSRAMWRLLPATPASSGDTSSTIRAKFLLTNGPNTPQPVHVNFVSEGMHLSGVDFQLVSPEYRLSLCKNRVVSGKYICEPEVDVKFV